MTNAVKLNKDVKKHLKKIYMKGNFSDVKIKDKESESWNWNSIGITFKFKNGILVNFWLTGNTLKYTVFSVIQPMATCKEYVMYSYKSSEINELDVNMLYSDIINKIDKIIKHTRSAVDCTAIDFENIDKAIEEI
ncbi:MAG: hypothetical protein E7310_05155 [Clostridiales bacterium]|nr:hypothetical protein [Clostridiales bacterium]